MQKIFLAGGGNKEQSKVVDALFEKEVKNVLYIPIAINTIKHPYKSCLEYIQSTIPKTKLTMVTDLNELSQLDLKMFDGIYIGGGDTVKLLYMLKSIHFLDKLKAFNGAIYGGSAGAIILGTSIDSAEKGTANFLPDKVGAGLVPYVVWPHYKTSDKITIRDPILKIPEDSYILFVDGKMQK